LIAFLLSGVRGAVQGELDAFFSLLARRSQLVRVVTASAFSKARGRLWANVFDLLNTELLRPRVRQFSRSMVIFRNRIAEKTTG
jgi:hypothetical protein